ncbi:helix-turn-helix domain-containing protein [Erysipelothrix aquatica]|uniref:helix-turn-helix domain-containing protein n=1 Tax=Erysipelothrix aquatica TaxID=2683714 RepID=UPI00135CA104|nr:helix-turn-helix transcriptional regulator [Erysipelothrix aquatica]
MDFGTKLKEARARLGLRQEDIADGIDVSRQTVSNWENNRSLPDLRSIVEISDIYQISLDDLLKGDRKVMEKLIKDSDIKTMENKLNILTLIVLVTSSLTLLFIDGDILSSTSMPVLNTVSIFLRILLIGLLFYTIIKYVKMRNDYQRQNGNENQPKYNTTKVIIVLAGLCVIGFLLGLFAALL